jgi:hypothetical protein
MDIEINNLSVKERSNDFDERPLSEILKEKMQETDSVLEKTRVIQ